MIDNIENNINIDSYELNEKTNSTIDIKKDNIVKEKKSLIQNLIELITDKLEKEKTCIENKQQYIVNEQQHKQELYEKTNEQQDEQNIYIKTTEQEIQKEKILVIDRFEGDFAVCENRDTLIMENIELSKLPQDLKQGDVIKFENNQYKIEEKLRNEIETRINDKMKNLFND